MSTSTAKPAPSSVKAGSSPGAYQTVFQVHQHHDRNMVAPHTLQHTYTRHPPLSAWGDNDKQLGHHHPPTRQNSSNSLPSRSQSAVFVQHSNNPAVTNQAPPPFFGRVDQQTFDHQAPRPALHSTRAVPAPPPIHSHLTAHWDQKHPPDLMDANHNTQELLSEYEHRPVPPQPPASREPPEPPTGTTMEQLSLRSVEDGANKIEELVIEEMAKMRAHFEELIREMQNQLARKQEENQSLEKRVRELETELSRLRIPKNG